MKTYNNILKASKTEQIDALIEGLPVNANGYFLSEEQADNIEATLAANDSVVEKMNGNLSAATTARDTAEASLATANETIAARDARIAELEAENTRLNAQPAADFNATSKEKDEAPAATKSAFHSSDENPMNKIADSLFPGKK